ncbi:MAG: sulfatase-like hydrolase/transferase, partial [Planctomycetota bacterium]
RIIEWTGAQDDDRPFFAYLAFTAPHDPLHVPDEWLDKYDGVYDDGYDALRESRLSSLRALGFVGADAAPFSRLPMIPAWDSLSAEQRVEQARRMEIYAAMVENMDHHVGRVLTHLKDIGKYDDTLIVFFSDNGANGLEMHQYPETDEAWVERNSDNRLENYGRRGSRIAMGPAWAQASMSPFRLFKAFIAEGGIRSPFVVSGPGVTRSGEISDAVGHVLDVVPTFLQVAGVEYPETYEGRDVIPLTGRSMIPHLAGTADVIRPADEPLGWEFLSWRALRLGHWKATWIARPFGISDWQLFDLDTDPGETRDVADEKPAILLDLIQRWEQYAEENGVILPDAPSPIGG